MQTYLYTKQESNWQHSIVNKIRRKDINSYAIRYPPAASNKTTMLSLLKLTEIGSQHKSSIMDFS